MQDAGDDSAWPYRGDTEWTVQEFTDHLLGEPGP
jgi:hypothetical protein